MSEIAKTVGQRIRSYRLQLGFSQEKVAELSGCHPTYIGQVERGEKNATLESIEKIAAAIEVPLSKLFDKIGCTPDDSTDIPAKCYELLLTKSKSEQEQIYRIILELDKYKDIHSERRPTLQMCKLFFIALCHRWTGSVLPLLAHRQRSHFLAYQG